MQNLSSKKKSPHRSWPLWRICFFSDISSVTSIHTIPSANTTAPTAADAKDWVWDVCSDTLPLCVRKECELMDERVKAGVEPLLLPVVAVYVSIECY